MNCDCRSYNRPDWGGTEPERMLTAPASFGFTKAVCVDPCMVPIIEALWAAGIVTLGCCCGHNGRATRHVVVSEPGDVARACVVIEGMSTQATQVIVLTNGIGD